MIERAKANATAQQAAKERALERRDVVIREKESVEQERDVCRGDVLRLQQLLAEPNEVPEDGMPWWVGLGLHALEFSGALVGGICLVNECSVSTIIMAFAVSAGAITLDITEIFGAFAHDD